MLSLLKKKTDGSRDSVIPAWHPDFRNAAALPDIKVVRTAFFINGAAAFIAIVLVVFLLAREYELYSINNQIQDWENQIARDKAGSTLAVSQYKKFQDEQQRITEVSEFVKSKPLVSQYLQRLGDTRPRNIAFDYIDIKDTGVTIRGVARGAAELATAEASAYLNVLKNDPILGPKFEDPVITSVVRNIGTGRLRIEVSLKFKAPKKP
jgi:hypothetical protein